MITEEEEGKGEPSSLLGNLTDGGFFAFDLI